jgi:hypothetical protein
VAESWFTKKLFKTVLFSIQAEPAPAKSGADRYLSMQVLCHAEIVISLVFSIGSGGAGKIV